MKNYPNSRAKGAFEREKGSRDPFCKQTYTTGAINRSQQKLRALKIIAMLAIV